MRCGQVSRPAARRQEGVLCYGCYAKDPEVIEPCARCGRLRCPATRQGDGQALCVNCCPRPERVCGTCGVAGRVKAIREGRPVCETCCRQPERLSGRCGRVGRIARRATDTSPDLCDN